MMARFSSGSLRPRQYESYYEQRSRLDALGISLPPKARVLELQAPFAKMAVDVLAEVLIPDGYILGDGERQDDIDLLASTWQANDMDSQFNLAATEALATGSAFWIMSPPDDDHEFATVRAFDNTRSAVRVDYAGEPIEGIAIYRLADGSKGATYYTPDGVTFYGQVGTRWVNRGISRNDPWGMSIVPMFNRARLRDRYGRSDLHELRRIIDAASRTLTNLQVAQEVAALPMRVLIGDGSDQVLEQFPDKMQAYMGRLLAVPDGADIKQVSGASLDTFTNTYRTYALQISAMTGIPPSMMGISSDGNPTSADALRVAKDRLIMRAENKQRQFSDALERVGRLIIAMDGGSLEGLEGLEVAWRDAAAPSASARMANAIQANAQGVLSNETTLEFLGLSPQQMKRELTASSDVRQMGGKALEAAQAAQAATSADATTARQVQGETNPTGSSNLTVERAQ